MRRSASPGLAALALIALSSVARADEKAACLAASEGADRLDDADKLLELKTRLEVCARDVCPNVVRQECIRRLEELGKRIPTLIVRAEANGNDVVDAKVSIDASEVAKSIDGKPIAVDPGPHKVKVVLGDGTSKEVDVVAAEGDHLRQVALSFSPAKKNDVAPPPPPPPTGEVKGGHPVQRWIGVGLIGTGVVLTVIGVALIPGALSEYSAYKAEGSNIGDCPIVSGVPVNGPGCHSLDSSQRNYNDRGNAIMFTAIPLLAVGTVAAVIGTVLVFTSFGQKRTALVTPWIGPGLAGVGLSGSF